MHPMAIMIKTPQEIEKMRRAGEIVREILELVRGLVKPGATTLDLEKVGGEEDCRAGCYSGFQGVSRFPVRSVHFGQQRSGARHSFGEDGFCMKGTLFRSTVER